MDYSLLKKIGGGNYGDVFSGSLEIAIKRIPKNQQKNKTYIKNQIEKEKY